MRFIVSVVATLAMFIAATAASASVDLSASGVILTGANAGSTDLTLAGVGDQVRIDINASNSGNNIAGATFSASAAGGLGGLQFDGGESAESWFSESLGKFGSPELGVVNIKGLDAGSPGTYTSYKLPNQLTGADIFNGALQFFSGAQPGSEANGCGCIDWGTAKEGDVLAGVGGVPGYGYTGADNASHAVLVFTLTAPGQTLLLLGQGPNDGLVVESGDGVLNGTSIAIGVIPEPGTALLMGLGLSGLSLAGRRRA